jgi:hypothetical protein
MSFSSSAQQMPAVAEDLYWSLPVNVAVAGRLLVTGTGSKRDVVITQLAFYSGARGVLRILAYLIEQGEYEELLRFNLLPVVNYVPSRSTAVTKVNIP